MRTVLIFLFHLNCCTAINAQIDFTTDSALLMQYYNKTEITDSHLVKPLTYKHKFLIKIPLLFYKKIMSSQISASCEYEPTCSTFSWLALDEFGLFKALLLTADRLTRCNGNSLPETFPYLIHPNDVKIVDYPVQYRLNK